jgi:anthraniloyl-CoA monooxygenase
MFTPLTLRGVTLPNRVVVSPMCMYSAKDGLVDDWHLVHLGSRAVGGAGLVLAEATGVSAQGRITPGCAGLYDDAHVAAWKRVVDFVHAHSDARIGVQIGHAGRKAACKAPWLGDGPLPADEAWPVVAPSPIPFGPGYQTPRALDRAGMDQVRQDFVAAARRAAAAGFDVLELHYAHGYLLGEFLSPLANRRDDAYGGSLDNRLRFPLEVVAAVRAAWTGPLLVRISASDWAEGGTSATDTVAIGRALAAAGVDLIDVSSGGTVPDGRPTGGRLYQTPLADRIRHEARVPVMTVGGVSSWDDVNSVVAARRADLVALAREHIFDPYFARHAAKAQGVAMPWPTPYGWVMDRYSPPRK